MPAAGRGLHTVVCFRSTRSVSNFRDGGEKKVALAGDSNVVTTAHFHLSQGSPLFPLFIFAFSPSRLFREGSKFMAYLG